MGQKMAEQYELQKLEPALRCELKQLKETVGRNINKMKSELEKELTEADFEENNVKKGEEEFEGKKKELEVLKLSLRLG
jgi:hypothetical protein